MELIIKYNEFINPDEKLNEGFVSRTFLALSLTLSSLFTNANSLKDTYLYSAQKYTLANDISNIDKKDTTTYRGWKIPTDDYIAWNNIKSDFNDIADNLYGLRGHVKDDRIEFIYDQLTRLYQQGEHIGLEEFVQKFNLIRPRLLFLVKEYGITNYNIEQICNHVSSKDYKRIYTDIGYLKKSTDDIVKKYKVTGWEKITTDDVILSIFLGIVVLFLLTFVGFIVWEEFLGDWVNDRADDIYGKYVKIRDNRRRKKYYHVHKDVDPYGEEKWWE